MYLIIDVKTNRPVGKPYQSIRRAYARADKLDLIYGAVRYIVKSI
jgi:hypothetical protein